MLHCHPDYVRQRKFHAAVRVTNHPFVLSIHLLTKMPPKRGSKKGKAKSAAKKTVSEPKVDDHPMPRDEAVLPAPVIEDNVNMETAGPDTLLNNGPTTADDMEQAEPKNGPIEVGTATIANSEQEKVRDVVTAETVSDSMAMDEEVARVEDDSRAVSKSSDEKEHSGGRRKEEANKMTMEERKAKFNELRKKMVRLTGPFFFMMVLLS